MTNENYVYNVKQPDGTYYSGPASGVPKPTPPAAATPDPVIATSPVRRYTSTGALDQPAPSGAKLSANGLYYAPGNDTPFSKAPVMNTDGSPTYGVDENAIRADMRAQVQGQIDAINNGLSATLAMDTVTGEKNLGRTRATGARSGVLGSDFGNAALDETQKGTDKVLAADRAAAEAQIANILANSDSRADAKIQTEKNAALKSNEDRIAELKQIADSAKQDVVSLAKSGVSFDQLSTDQLAKFLDQTGWSKEDLQAQFTLNKPADQILYQGLQGNKYIVVTKDPITKQPKTETIDLGFHVPEGYTSEKLANGQLLFMPKDWNGDTSKLITYGPKADTGNTTVVIPSFDEYLSQQQLAAKSSFAPEKVAQVRAEYDTKYGPGGTATIPLGDVTPTDKNSLARAGIANAGNDVKSYYLSTPSAFQDKIARDYASGAIAPGTLSIEKLNTEYSAWYEAQQNSAIDWTKALAGAGG